MTWPFDKLCQFLESNPSVSAIFDLLIGKDISDKLYQIQEMLLSNPESPLRQKLDSSPVRLQRFTPSPHSSLMNLRGVVVSESSTSSLDHVHCFGIDIKGNQSWFYFASHSKKEYLRKIKLSFDFQQNVHDFSEKECIYLIPITTPMHSCRGNTLYQVLFVTILFRDSHVVKRFTASNFRNRFFLAYDRHSWTVLRRGDSRQIFSHANKN